MKQLNQHNFRPPIISEELRDITEALTDECKLLYPVLAERQTTIVPSTKEIDEQTSKSLNEPHREDELLTTLAGIAEQG